MIRRLITVAFAALSLGNASAQDAKLKIATVDMSLLFKEYYQTNLAQQEINVERARIQKDNNEQLATITSLKADIDVLKQQIDDPSISDQKKAQVYKEYQTKYQDGILLENQRRDYMGRKEKALQAKTVGRMRGILEEIRKLVETRAKAENYDYVFDKSGMSTSQVPFLLYAKDATEITALLLQELNKNAPADITTTNSAPDLAPIEDTPDVKR